MFQKLIVGPSPSEKTQGTKAEAGDVGSIVDAGRQSHGALQPGEARATFETPSKAEHGVQLLERLSEDLQRKLGGGFSERNLYRMRQCYLAHKIWPPAAKLSWTQHVELLPATNNYVSQGNLRSLQTSAATHTYHSKDPT